MRTIMTSPLFAYELLESLRDASGSHLRGNNAKTIRT